MSYDIKLVHAEGGYFKLQRDNEVVSVCGCCGKRIDARAAAHLLAKLHANEIGWDVIYLAGLAAEGKEI